MLNWLAPEIRQIALEAAVGRAVDIARHETGVLRSQLKALQAVDVGLYKETGKIVILASVAGQDIVNVIDVKPGWTMLEYKTLVRQIEMRFGVRPQWVDAGTGAGRTIAEDIKHGR